MSTLNMFVDSLCKKMDEVMVKYRDNKHPPIILTDKDEIIAILAGMGLVEFKEEAGGVHITSKGPVSIAWDGSTFVIYEHKDK